MTMTVAQAGTIDWLSLGKERRQITLFIVDDLEPEDLDRRASVVQLEVRDTPTSVGPGGVERHLSCPRCGAYNAILLPH